MTSTRCRSPRAGRLGDPETIHFGLIPRSHRGIVAINELPDLAERIQVAMLNVMEERDIQIRGYVLRLPLDVLVVASANPEDYTNRGRIITPLKDRFGAEIRTHYPLELDDEVAVIRQEAHLVGRRAGRARRGHRPVHPAAARLPRGGPALGCVGAVRHRRRRDGRRGGTAPGDAQGEDHAVARVVDLEAALDVLRGKVEFESGEEGREREVLAHLLRTATAETVRTAPRRHRPRACSSTPSRRARSSRRASGSARASSSTGCRCSASRTSTTRCANGSMRTNDGERASAIELALEGLYLARRITKDTADGETVYG